MSSSGMLGRVALVRTDYSEKLSASIIQVARIVVYYHPADGAPKFLRNVGSYKSRTE
jgi:hypothetical protein